VALLTDQEILDIITIEPNRGYRLLMTQYQEQLYWHIRNIVTWHEDADDVVQNTFIKIFRNLDRFKGDSKLLTWMYRIATNESISFLRSKKRKQTDSLDGDYSISEQLKADQYFDGNSAQLILTEAMNRLPEKQKAVFSMRYYEEIPYAEMSKIMDTSVGALKASYHHAVKKIEEYIKNERRD